MEFTLPSHPVTPDEFVALLQPGTALIMRGAPGSGKSTVVDKLKARAAAAQPRKLIVGVASADAHRMVEGKYVFDPKKNDEAHGGCLLDFIHSASVGDRYGKDYDFIICDNTNVNLQEVAPYYAIARAYGWHPVVVNVETDPTVAAARNVHGVPEAHVHRMADRIARFRLPGNYRQVTVRTIPA